MSHRSCHIDRVPSIVSHRSCPTPIVSRSCHIVSCHIVSHGSCLIVSHRFPSCHIDRVTSCHDRVTIVSRSCHNRVISSFPRPMFSRVRNAKKLSFAFYDLSNYLKIQNGRHFWDFTLIREALYFLFLDPCFQRYGMQWSYHFCSTITATTSNFCGSFKLTGQLFIRSISLKMVYQKLKFVFRLYHLKIILKSLLIYLLIISLLNKLLLIVVVILNFLLHLENISSYCYIPGVCNKGHPKKYS